MNLTPGMQIKCCQAFEEMSKDSMPKEACCSEGTKDIHRAVVRCCIKYSATVKKSKLATVTNYVTFVTW